jgi:hypothetical protein
MATREKAEGRAKPKPKRKKSRVAKTASSRKALTARKIRKKAGNKVSLRRASPKRAEPTAKAAVKPKPARPPAPPAPAGPTTSPLAQTGPMEERIGFVTHYYGHLSVATLRLESGRLRVGDVIRIRGHTTDFTQKVESLEVDHAPVTDVGPNVDFGLKVVEHAREHDIVFKLR